MGFGVNFTGESISFGSLSFAIGNFGSDLHGVCGTAKELLVRPVALMSEAFCQSERMIETTFAHMLADGGQGNDNHGREI